jgi:hypothetical protein
MTELYNRQKNMAIVETIHPNTYRGWGEFLLNYVKEKSPNWPGEVKFLLSKRSSLKVLMLSGHPLSLVSALTITKLFTAFV